MSIIDWFRAQVTLPNVVFFSIYFIEGLITAFFGVNALYLLEKGLTIEQIGIFEGSVYIPLACKIPIGIFLDKVMTISYPVPLIRYRKFWIMVFITCQAISFALLYLVDPVTHYKAYVIIAFLMLISWAIYDTATDGLAIDVQKENQHGATQTIMTFSRYFAVLIISPILTQLASRVSWAAVFFVLAGLSLLPLIPLIIFTEPSNADSKGFDWRAFSLFIKPPYLTAALMGFPLFFSGSGAEEFFLPFLKTEIKVPLDIAGAYKSMYALGILIGSIAGGIFYKRYSRITANIVAYILSAIVIGLLATIISPAMAWPFVILFGFGTGFYHVNWFALCMYFSAKKPGSAASMFAIFSTVASCGTIASAPFGGWLARNKGYHVTFLVFAGIVLLGLITVPFTYRYDKSSKQSSIPSSIQDIQDIDELHES